ncbi:MAG: hypothetical protein R3D44_03585 [Hyphomicrobiaceae bacterium]
MATIVTVHGTFAHSEAGNGSGAGAPESLQWWQSGSAFDHEIRELLDASPGEGSGKLEVRQFEWDGLNSELSRRAAGKRLFEDLKALDATGEPYAVVAHSHGGSVMSWALLESAARKQRLDGLRRWITVGTPFVSMKKERLLFQRLDLMRKVVFVASLMLLLMFLVYMATETWAGDRMLFGATFPAVLVVTAVMMSLPVIFFYLVLKYWDARTLLHYRRRVRQRAAEAFGSRWLSLTHADDEAVQGLAFLPGAELSFFDRTFAVSAITTISIFALPLIYLLVLTTPTVMVGIGDWLKTNVYETRMNPEAEKALREARQKIIEMRRQQQQNASTAGTARRGAAWEQYREARRALEARFPDLRNAERALRFRQRFFEANGKPCNNGKLCGAGRDLRINSGLLLHLVTDELSSAIGGEDAMTRTQRGLIRLLVPAIVVPLIFGLLSLLLMLLINTIAKVVSRAASVLLNNITNAEVKRAAFGNDTEGEIAVGAIDRPSWIEASPPRLPSGIADLVTGYSNGIASQSLAKFRRAIGQLASAEPKHTADTAITTYFTWKELVHGSYFDVPEFRRLVAQAISRTDGFTPSRTFRSDPAYGGTAQWLAEIEGTSPTGVKPADAVPTNQDKGAVAAVVASTVKREP